MCPCMYTMDAGDDDLLLTAKQGDNALGSVRPSVRPSVRLSVRPSVRPSVRLSVRPCPLSQLNQVQQREIITLKFETKMKRAEKSDFQSEVFVCVSTNRADAVDRLLICICYRLQSISKEVR